MVHGGMEGRLLNPPESLRDVVPRPSKRPREAEETE